MSSPAVIMECEHGRMVAAHSLVSSTIVEAVRWLAEDMRPGDRISVSTSEAVRTLEVCQKCLGRPARLFESEPA